MGAPFKMNPKTPFMKALTQKQEQNLPPKLKDAIKAAPEDSPATSYGKPPMKKDPKAKDPKAKKKDDFRYESDMPGVTGTTYTKDTKETTSDYTRKGQPAKVGQKTSDPSFNPGQKPTVTSTYRDRSGRKQAGRTGKIEVEIKEGSTRFTTDKKKTGAGRKSPARSYGKSPAKMHGKSPAKMKGVKGLKK